MGNKKVLVVQGTDIVKNNSELMVAPGVIDVEIDVVLNGTDWGTVRSNVSEKIMAKLCRDCPMMPWRAATVDHRWRLFKLAVTASVLDGARLRVGAVAMCILWAVRRRLSFFL